MSVSSTSFTSYSMIISFVVGLGSIAVFDRFLRRDLEAKVEELEFKVNWLMTKMESMERESAGISQNKTESPSKFERLHIPSSEIQSSGQRSDGGITSLTQSGKDMIVKCYGAFANFDRKNSLQISSTESVETIQMAVENHNQNSPIDSSMRPSSNSTPSLAQLRQLKKHSSEESRSRAESFPST